MEQKLVELVTKLVVEKLGQQPVQELVLQSKPQLKKERSAPLMSTEDTGLISLFGTSGAVEEKASNAYTQESKPSLKPVELKEEMDEKFVHATSKTPARIAVGRTGSRPLTSTILKFRLDHAAAVDAVHGVVEQSILDELQLFTVHTKAEENKETYILRPDFGRKLTDESKQLLNEKGTKNARVQIIVSNGLSASAINENLLNVYRSLQQSLQSLGLQQGVPFYVEQGRVGLMDDIGELLQPDVVVYLIGERPGLVSAESMSAYICYQPRQHTIESDRTVVSNIHKGGIPPVEAGAYLGNIIEKILKYKASGVNLVKIEE